MGENNTFKQLASLERKNKNRYSYRERFCARRCRLYAFENAHRSYLTPSATIYRKERTVSFVEQGLVLMIVGMAVVFSFLIILVFSTKLLSSFIHKFFPEKEQVVKKRTQPAGKPAPTGGSGASSSDAEIAAAVAAAAAYSKR
ncbi:MAG: OadG family protein [Spirochaetota bacterium]